MVRAAAVISGLVAAAVLASCSSSSNNAQTTITTAATTSIITSRPETIPTTTSTALPTVVIANKGFSFAPSSPVGPIITYAVVVQNPSQGHVANDVVLNLTFTDAVGTVVASKNETIDTVLPSQSAAAGDELLKSSGSPTRMDVQAQVTRWDDTVGPTGGLQAQGVTVTTEQTGVSTEATVRGTVISTFARDIQKSTAVAVMYNSAGAVVGGANAFVDFVPANGRASFEIHALSQSPTVRRADVFASPTILSR